MDTFAMHRRLLSAIVLALTIATRVHGEPVQPDAHEHDLNIARQRVSQALQELSRQTGVQHGYSPTSAEEEATLVGPVSGRYTIDAALAKMLDPVGFGYIWSDARTVSIVPPPAMPPKKRLLGRQERKKAVSRSNFDQQDRSIIDNVVVTRERDHSLQEWSFGAKSPALVVFDRERLDQFGVSTIPEALRYLPQLPYCGGNCNGQLRGLGGDTTLVLINGRRVAVGGVANTFDLETLPLTAVERIEVLLDTPTVAAGADSIGGIINIVLKQDISGASAEVRYGTASGGSAERRLSVSVGGRVSQRARASASIDYFDRTSLLGNDRDLWRNQDFRRFGGADYRAPYSSRGNISSIYPGNLPGLPSPIATVPEGSTGIGMTSADFIPTAGQTNFESLSRFQSVLPKLARWSFVGSANVDLWDRATAFTELIHVDQVWDFESQPSTFSGIVPAENPFNPFHVPILFQALLEPIHQTSQSNWLRGLVGAHGPLGNWEWEAVVARTEGEMQSSAEGYVNAQRASALLSQTDPALAPNLFRDDLSSNESFIAAITDTPLRSRFATQSSAARATLRGSMMSMPGGAVGAFLGAEYRNERAPLRTCRSIVRTER